MKYTIQILMIAFLIALNGCKKEDDKSPCADCTISGKVVYLPIGCVGNSSTLGLEDAKGNYYYIDKDLTGHFDKYTEGEEVCFDFDAKKACNFELTTGIMEIPITCIDLTCLGKCRVEKEQDCYTIAYLPTQCADYEFTNTLGFKDASGNYYLVKEDKSGDFEKFKNGDKVKLKFDKTKECMVCYACTCPKPDYCAIVYSVFSCESEEEEDCSKAVLNAYYEPKVKEQEPHQVSILGYANGELSVKIGVSGCDGDIAPELILRKSQLKSYPQIYDAYLNFKRKPQLCDAAFQVTECFDISTLMNQEKQARIIFHDSSGETKEKIVE